MTARAQGLLCAAGVLLIWAGFTLTSRLSAVQDITPWDMATLRHAGAFLAALPLVAWRGLPRIAPARAFWIAFTAAAIFPLLAYWGFQFAPAAHGAVLLPGLLPFLAAAMWWWAFGVRWTWRRYASLALVALGMGLLAGDTFGAHPGAWRGDLFFIAACLTWTVYMWMVARWAVSATDATLAIAVYGLPLYLPLWWLALPSNLAAIPPGVALFHMAYQGVLSVLVAGFLFTRAQLLLGGPQTSAVTSVVPVLVALGAWPLLGEALGVLGMGGVALVTAGMIAGVAGPARGVR